MTERIAAGEIYIGVRDAEAMEALRRIQERFNRTMRDIEDSEAEATVGADLSKLKDDLANAKRMLRQLQAEEANLGVEISDADKAKLKKDIADAKALIKSIDGEVATVEIEVHGEKEALRAQKAIQKATEERIEAEDRLIREVERTRDQAARRNTQRVNQEARVRESLHRQRLRELDTAEREAYQIERERLSLPKLEQAYVSLHDKLEKLNSARRKARSDQGAMFRVNLEEGATVAKIEALRAEIQRIAGRDPIEIPVKPELGRRWGEFLRVEMGRHNGVLSAVAVSTGLHIGRQMKVGISRGLERGIVDTAQGALKSLGTTAGRGTLNILSRIGHAAGGLADSTIRLGPFTTTIRKAVVGLSLFAPILLDVVGALGALTGAVGSATLGLGALTVGLAGGAIPSFLGVGIVIKQVASEFKSVMAAQKAYDDAVRKGNTDLAAKKMKELKATMGNVSKETVQNIGLARKLNGAWKEATQPARAAVWRTIGEGIKSASDLMPQFAARTNIVTQTLSTGLDKWMRGLRSDAGRGALFEMMDNFNLALGPALDGLGSLVAYLGRVGQIASRVLPGMSSDFKTWADGINSVTTSDLERKVDKTINSLRSLGRFLMSAGRLVKAFFGAGVDSGNDLLTTMSNAMNRWTSWMNTVEGKNSLGQFFDEAVSGTQSLWNTLQPVVTSFVRWAANMAPFSRAFFDGAAAIANMVSEFLRLTGLSGPLAALATTLGGLWAIGKIGAATTALRGFVTALTGVTAAETATATAAGRATAALTAQAIAAERAAVAGGMGAGALALGGGAMSSTRRTAAAAEEAAQASRLAKVGAAANGASMALLGMRAATAGYVGAAALAGYGLYKLMTRASEFEVAQNAANASMNEAAAAAQNMATAQSQSVDKALSLESAQLNVESLEKQLKGLKKGTLEYRSTLNQLRVARRQEGMEAQSLGQSMQEELKFRTDLKVAADEEVRSRKKIVDDQREQLENMKEISANAKDTKTVQDRLNAALDDYHAAQRRARAASDAATLSYYNQERALAKLRPMAATAARAFARLQKLGGQKLATNIALKYDDPSKAARVGQAASRALKSGAGRGVVLKIVADSKNAEQAVKTLNRMHLDQKVLKVIASDSDAKTKVKKLIDLGIPPKLAKIIGDNSDALAKGREAERQRLNPIQQAITRFLSNPGFTGPQPPTITQWVRRALKNTTWADGGMAFAAGFASGAQPNPRQQERAARTAALSGSPAAAQSQKVNRPRYLVGEEATPEFIVSTNPKYRERNQKYAAMAARAVGLDVIKAANGFGGFTPSGHGPSPGGSRGFIPGGSAHLGGDTEFHPKAKIKRGKKFTPSKKKKKKFAATRSWNNYIDGLHTQQDYWEREVSIREQQVQEPEDLIVRDPQNDSKVVDPTTGETVTVEAYKANPDIEGYKQQLQRVLDAMDTLMKIVTELVRAIPLAIKANQQEAKFHENRVEHFEGKIKGYKTSKADADKDHKDVWERRIQKARAHKDHHEGQLSTLREDIKTLRADRVEAGFDYREYTIQRDELRKEKRGILAEANQAAKEETDANDPTKGGSGGGGSGGSGGTSGGVSYAQQTAMVDSEKASILQQFGSNFSPTGSGGALAGLASAAGVGANQGMSANQASNSLGLVSGSGVGGPMGGASSAAAASLASSSGAAGAVSPTVGAAGSGGGNVVTEGDKIVNVNATFAEVPPDPHTFVKGVEFEVGAVI